MKHFETDVAVIGCGVAGMTAALSALESGAKVINIERSTFEERGGNSRWTDANMALKFGQEEPEWNDAFWSSFERNHGYHVDPEMMAETANDYASWHPNVKTAPFLDPELLSAFAEGMPDTVEWLQNHGVDFNMDGQFFPFFLRIMLMPYITGGGLEVIEKLTPLIQAKGGEFLCETTAVKLLEDDMGRVCGVRCAGKNNEPVEVKAKAVILASGGFEGNPQMLAQYVGKNSRYMRPVARGGYFNKGEGLRMALDLNAAPSGDWSDVHLQQVDPRSTHPEALVDIWPCGIVVNQNGDRFMDECPHDPNTFQESAGRAVVEQEGGIGYIIYDDQLHSGDQSWRFGIRSEVPPIQADSLEALAEQLNVPADKLINTVESYNNACYDSDQVDYTRYGVAEGALFDCIGTQGLAIPKSNYAKRIDKPPFFCYPMMSSICLTCGGLRVTPEAQVVNYSGDVIPGLYAAGETIGMYYREYVGATSVLRGLIFGRIAGNHAAS
jgi:tricarballylate dehydrogenase